MGCWRPRTEPNKVEVYDDLVPQVLDRVRMGAKTLTDVVASLDTDPDTTFTIARIERDRESALAAYRRDRDIHALEQTMADLDAEEASAKTSTKTVPASEAVAWLDDLPGFVGGSGRLGQASPDGGILRDGRGSIGHDPPDAGGRCSRLVGRIRTLPLLLNAGRAFSTDGRGERACPSDNHLSVEAIRLAHMTGAISSSVGKYVR